MLGINLSLCEGGHKCNLISVVFAVISVFQIPLLSDYVSAKYTIISLVYPINLFLQDEEETPAKTNEDSRDQGG